MQSLKNNMDGHKCNKCGCARSRTREYAASEPVPSIAEPYLARVPPSTSCVHTEARYDLSNSKQIESSNSVSGSDVDEAVSNIIKHQSNSIERLEAMQRHLVSTLVSVSGLWFNTTYQDRPLSADDVSRIVLAYLYPLASCSPAIRDSCAAVYYSAGTSPQADEANGRGPCEVNDPSNPTEIARLVESFVPSLGLHGQTSIGGQLSSASTSIPSSLPSIPGVTCQRLGWSAVVQFPTGVVPGVSRSVSGGHASAAVLSERCAAVKSILAEWLQIPERRVDVFCSGGRSGESPSKVCVRVFDSEDPSAKTCLMCLNEVASLLLPQVGAPLESGPGMTRETVGEAAKASARLSKLVDMSSWEFDGFAGELARLYRLNLDRSRPTASLGQTETIYSQRAISAAHVNASSASSSLGVALGAMGVPLAMPSRSTLQNIGARGSSTPPMSSAQRETYANRNESGAWKDASGAKTPLSLGQQSPAQLVQGHRGFSPSSQKSDSEGPTPGPKRFVPVVAAPSLTNRFLKDASGSVTPLERPGLSSGSLGLPNGSLSGFNMLGMDVSKNGYTPTGYASKPGSIAATPRGNSGVPALSLPTSTFLSRP